VQNGEIQFFLLLGQLFAYIYKYGKKTQQTLAIEHAPDNMAATPIILKVIDYINLHYTEKISLDELSNTYGISKTWLIKCFYQTTKKTIINYKITLQINAAKKLLHTTGKSLDAIAKECGFSSTNYFRIMFKRYVHIAPNKYRKHTVSTR
jgi:AraC-like DNA-binding protein